MSASGTPSFIQLTARNIAFLLLFIFGASLLLILASAVFFDTKANNVWFDLFKSGFLILAGGVTTVIGYYFGSQGTQEAQESQVKAEIKSKDSIDKAEKEKAAAETVKAEAEKVVVEVEGLKNLKQILEERVKDLVDEVGPIDQEEEMEEAEEVEAPTEDEDQLESFPSP